MQYNYRPQILILAESEAEILTSIHVCDTVRLFCYDRKIIILHFLIFVNSNMFALHILKNVDEEIE